MAAAATPNSRVIPKFAGQLLPKLETDATPEAAKYWLRAVRRVFFAVVKKGLADEIHRLSTDGNEG